MPDAPVPEAARPDGRPPPLRARWVLLVAYDGSAFRGFADQPGLLTVAGALSGALRRTTRAPGGLPLGCAGRTDAGVHARGQVVHVDLPDPLPEVRQPSGQRGPLTAAQLCRAVNRQLAPRIVVREAQLAPAGFDARHCAQARSYRYLVWNAEVADPLLAPVSWHVAGGLEMRAMAAAADACVGEHDFRAFCRRLPQSAADDPIRRRVLDARWSRVSPSPVCPGAGHLLRFDITANAFCHQMVRSLVAFLVDAGRRRRTAADLVAQVRTGSRRGLPAPAPPGGLCLESVAYPAGLLQWDDAP